MMFFDEDNSKFLPTSYFPERKPTNINTYICKKYFWGGKKIHTKEIKIILIHPFHKIKCKNRSSLVKLHLKILWFEFTDNIGNWSTYLKMLRTGLQKHCHFFQRLSDPVSMFDELACSCIVRHSGWKLHKNTQWWISYALQS